MCVLHNWIIVNNETIWEQLDMPRKLEIDTEVIAALAVEHVANGKDLGELSARVFDLCQGVAACAVALPRLGKLCLFSNNGSLYLGTKDGATYFSSERFPLEYVGCMNIAEVREGVILDIPVASEDFVVADRQ